MKKKSALMLGSVLIAGAAGGACLAVSGPHHAAAVGDPRQKPPLVIVATAAPVKGVERSFTGFIEARVQSNLGFRVPGKIVERLVDVGQTVKAGQLSNGVGTGPLIGVQKGL